MTAAIATVLSRRLAGDLDPGGGIAAAISGEREASPQFLAPGRFSARQAACYI
jgi:hypothetical protein